MKALIFIMFLSVTSLAFADMDGSYEYSLNKYPEITKLINANNLEGELSLVNVHMENDGLFPLKINKNKELLLVNYITFSKYTTNSYNVFLEKKNNIYSISKLGVPSLSEIENNGEIYTLHAETVTIKDNSVIQNYSFACRKPATFSRPGNCYKGIIYEVNIIYQYINNKFEITKKKFAKKI